MQLNGELARTLDGYYMTQVAFSPDKRTLASEHNGDIVLLDINTGQIRQKFEGQFSIESTAFNSNGNVRLQTAEETAMYTSGTRALAGLCAPFRCQTVKRTVSSLAPTDVSLPLDPVTGLCVLWEI